MGTHYPVLRYPGNVTGSDTAQPGALLGWDEIGRQYEVVDAEFIPDNEHDECGDPYCTGIDCDIEAEVPGHTNVFLQYATVETLRRATEDTS